MMGPRVGDGLGVLLAKWPKLFFVLPKEQI